MSDAIYIINLQLPGVPPDRTNTEVTMSVRATKLSETADRQISGLIDLLDATDASALSLPCSGREKLGDGTVGALAKHTADNYRRIAEFVAAGAQQSVRHGHTREVLHGQSPQPLEHSPREHGDDHAQRYTADGVDLRNLTAQFTAARHELARIGELTDAQLDAVPPSGSGRRPRSATLASATRDPATTAAALARPPMVGASCSSCPDPEHPRTSRATSRGRSRTYRSATCRPTCRRHAVDHPIHSLAVDVRRCEPRNAATSAGCLTVSRSCRTAAGPSSGRERPHSAIVQPNNHRP
jgi:hypothetical protein